MLDRISQQLAVYWLILQLTSSLLQRNAQISKLSQSLRLLCSISSKSTYSQKWIVCIQKSQLNPPVEVRSSSSWSMFWVWYEFYHIPTTLLHVFLAPVGVAYPCWSFGVLPIDESIAYSNVLQNDFLLTFQSVFFSSGIIKGPTLNNLLEYYCCSVVCKMVAAFSHWFDWDRKSGPIVNRRGHWERRCLIELLLLLLLWGFWTTSLAEVCLLKSTGSCSSFFPLTDWNNFKIVLLEN